MSSHALLGPSGASKWIACPPSARLEQQFPDRESSYAAEGTLAHRIGEIMIAKKAGKISKQKYSQELAKCKKNVLFDKEMIRYMEDYSDKIIESFAKVLSISPTAILMQEQQLDYSHIVPEGFGTLDVGMHYESLPEGCELFIDDLKYGKGVPVSAVDNKQLRIYSEAYCKKFGIKPLKITMRIHQPRIDNYSEWTISYEELQEFINGEVVPAAKLAWEGKGEFNAGKHCQFCRARPRCRKNEEYQNEVAKHDFQLPALLDDNELAEILLRADDVKSWLKSVQDYALHEAFTNRKKFPGLKLVHGISKRAYSDKQKLLSLLKIFGFKENEYLKKEIVGITELQKIMPTKMFNAAIEPLLFKPKGKPTLVDESSDRPEFDFSNAQSDFEGLENE